MSPSAASPSLAERFSAVIHRVMVGVASRVRQAPPMWHPAGVLIPLAMESLVNGWLMRQRRLILALMARIAAGTLSPPRPYAPRPLADDAAPKPARETPLRGTRRPFGFGWLSAMASEVNVFSGWLMQLIEEPQMRALCLATPRMGRLLSPILHALGQKLPEWVPRPPRRPRKPRPRKVRALSPLAAWREHAKWCAQSGRGGGKRFWRNPKGTMFDPRLPMPADPPPPKPPAPPPLPEIGVVVRRGPAPFWETQVGAPYRPMFGLPFGGTFRPDDRPAEEPGVPDDPKLKGS